MTVITWIIEWMQAKPVEGSLTNVVITAAWRCNGVDGNYMGTVYGTAGFPASDPSNFIPYTSLTESQVLDWCWAGSVDKSAVEAAIQAQIDNQINPPVVQIPLPWSV